MKDYLAGKLLEIKAVYLQPNNPFTWSSGIKSPIYCDNRLTLSYPELRKEIAKGLQVLIEEKFPDTEIIAGTATAGIPHAAWVSDLMNLPMCYVRSSAKGHGKGNQIEGQVKTGQNVVVIEDLISTGGSSITAVKALREAGCNVLGVASIFTYGMEKAEQQFAQAGIPAYALSDYSTLINVAKDQDYIEGKDMKKLETWRENPAGTEWLEG
ncbi:orotate phosphoribosyltransferase [Peribacillus saganii]|uniref:Orotate phosphoribosyltransferase n=1 Tax=Peribacillus saganii TaxID=2303992 RepID=A0A372LDG2_9BACI|nr:orotate phosphoribosyltransferase [Peribacillus saganii]RFU63210.1 orotate phosphoribosyltransferase [Peribacillus saganii]